MTNSVKYDEICNLRSYFSSYYDFYLHISYIWLDIIMTNLEDLSDNQLQSRYIAKISNDNVHHLLQVLRLIIDMYWFEDIRMMKQWLHLYASW
jgi:hypothetical protein